MSASAPVIQAIPTEYAGVLFRSRLEARWAVFFNQLGIEWDYEPEGFTDGETRYLPDFWLPSFGYFWEVKPENHLDDDAAWKETQGKAQMLTLLPHANGVFVVCGPPAPCLESAPWDGLNYEVFLFDECGILHRCPIWTEVNGEIRLRDAHKVRHGGAMKRVNDAARTARSYRFWDPK